MDQTVGMDHLNGSGEGGGLLPVAAAKTAKFKGKDRAQPFAACQKAVFHGVEENLLGFGIKTRIVAFQIVFDVSPVLLEACFIVHR